LIPAQPVSQKLILCIDDDPPILSCEKALPERFGYCVTTAATAQERLSIATTRKFDAALFDYEMPGRNGCDVASEIKRVMPEPAMTLLSGSGVPSYALVVFDAFILQLEASPALLPKIAALCGGNRDHKRKKSCFSHRKQ
jgi:CheY-like chemotaxis protein